MTINHGNDGIPQHAAPPQGFWASLPARTVVQGILIDVLLSVCLVVYAALQDNSNIDWAVLGLLLLKTVLMALASSIMKRVKPLP